MKKKYLFISNSNKPTLSQLESRNKVKLGNVRIPCVEAALCQGYEVYVGLNRTHAEELESENGFDIKFYNQNIFRDILDIRNNYTAYKNLWQLLNKEKFDVIHCNTPIGGVLGRICGKRAGVSKIIYTAHGFHFYKGASFMNRTLFKWAETWLAHYTDAIITMNQEDYEAANKFKLRKGGKVYFVHGVGINTEQHVEVKVSREQYREVLGIPAEDFICISAGDLILRKNYETAIKAIAETKNSRVHLLICGKGPEEDKLRQLAESTGVANQIHFLGFRTDIKQLLKISDCYLFTSIQEGMPRSLMEAMASYLPCVVSRIRGNTDLIKDGEGGLLCDAKDASAFASSINKLYESPELCEKMAKCNLELILDYDVANVKEEIRAIYHEVLSRE